MKIILLIIFALTGIILQINLAYGLPEMTDCRYESDFVTSTNKLEFDVGETFVLKVRTVHDDTEFEIDVINPEGRNVFTKTTNVDNIGYAHTRFHIPDDAQSGTWTVFVNAMPSHEQEVIFIGVDESPKSLLLTKPSFVNYEYKKDDALFLVAGKPDSDIQITIEEPYNSKKHIYVTALPSEGKCSFALDLDQYKPGVYNVEITDYTDTADTTFSIGLQPSRGVIAIMTSSTEYHPEDKVSVQGGTTPNTELAIGVFDASGNVVYQLSTISDGNGAINASFYLPKNADTGKWKVRATASPNFDTVEFDVSKRLYTKTYDGKEKTVIEVDGYPVLLSNSHVIDVALDWDADDLPSGRILFDDTITDTLKMQIPKNMPRAMNLDFGSSLYVTFPKPQYKPIPETESDCFYILTISVRDSDEIRFGSGSVAAGRWEPVVVDNDFCDNVYSEILEDDRQNTSDTLSYETNSHTSKLESVENQESRTYSITNKQVRYNIPYKITNGTITEMKIDCRASSFIVNMNNSNDGKLELDIPKNMLNPNTTSQYDRFFILVDGEEIDYDEIPYTKYRKISIPFAADTKEIEIVQTWIPEGPKPEACRIAHDPPYSYILSPLKQFKSGVPYDGIQCMENLVLVQKHDDTPACVKPESVSMLDERGWTDTQNVTKANPTENNILRYSPILFKGSGINLDKNEFTAEDFQQVQQRKTELEVLLGDKSISEEIRDDMKEESRMIQYYSQQAFDENVPFELITVLWEKRMQFREFLSMQTRDGVFPIACTGGISVGYHAYSLDEKYVGNPTALIISIPEEHFTKSNLQKADVIIRDQIGEEIDVVYNKSDCYAIALNESTG